MTSASGHKKKMLEPTSQNVHQGQSSKSSKSHHLFGNKKKNKSPNDNHHQKQQDRDDDNVSTRQQQIIQNSNNKFTTNHNNNNHINSTSSRNSSNNNMIDTNDDDDDDDETDTSQLIDCRSQSSSSGKSSIINNSSNSSSDTDDTDEGIMITSSSTLDSHQSNSDLSSSKYPSINSGNSTPDELYYSRENIETTDGQTSVINQLIKEIRSSFLERNNLLHLLEQNNSTSSQPINRITNSTSHDSAENNNQEQCNGVIGNFYLEDVLTLIKRDFLIRRFIDQKNPNQETSVKALEELFTWRKSIAIRNWNDETFPIEFYTMNGMFVAGLDKQHMPVMYMRARAHRQWTPKLDELFKNFVAYQVDKTSKLFHYEDDDDDADHHEVDRNEDLKHQQIDGNNGANGDDGKTLLLSSSSSSSSSSASASERGTFTICFDCRGATYSCLDMEFLRFLVKLLVNYYPQSCKYAIVVDIPWIFKSVWKLVKTWLPADCQETVKFVSLKQLIEFIESNHIPQCMQATTTAKQHSNSATSNSGAKSSGKQHHQPEETQYDDTVKTKWQTSWPIPVTCRSIADFTEQVEMSQSQLKAFLTHIEKLNTVV